MINRRKKQLISAAVLAVASGSSSNLVFSEESVGTLEEVLVTARKRSENLQEVPMAVSAYNSEQLRDAQITNIVDLERMSPNITLTETGGLVGGAVQVFMRGIGNDSGFDQGVGIYLDDVYLNRTTGALLEVYDTERIEILKGPQGNLYGRNTIGGAIKYISKEAGDQLEINAELKAGDYDLVQLKGSVSGPLIANTLYASFGFLDKKQGEGFQRNAFDGNEYWASEAQALRGSLIFKPSDTLKLKLAADYSKDDSAARVPNRVAVDPGTLAGIDFVINGANSFLGAGTGLTTEANDVSLPASEDIVNTEFVDGFDQFEIEALSIAFNLEWDISESWSFKSVTAQRDIDNVQPFDFDGSSQEFIHTINYRESSDLSQEFQFNFNSEELNAVIGAYYLDGTQKSPSQTFQNFRLRAIQTQLKETSKDTRDIESKSVYASVDWDFTSDWQLTLGARYTEDEKNEEQIATVTDGYYAYAGLAGFPSNAIVAVAPGQEANATQSPLFLYWASQFVPPNNTVYTVIESPENTVANDSWSEFTPSARLSYTLNDDVMLYGGYATGFKSGGFQRTGGLATAYRPETVETYSLGVKSRLFDSRLQLNAEAFYNDYQDKQLSTIVLDGADLSETVGNVGEMSSSGFEVEALWLPGIEGLMLGLNVGYLDVDVEKYASFDDVGAPIDLSSTTEVGFSPEWTSQARVQYDIDLTGVGVVMLATDVSYRAESFTNSPVDTTNALELSQVQDEHHIWNALVALRTEDDRWRVSLEGKNLNNERVLTNTFVVGPFVTGGYNQPRTWAVTVAYSY